MPLFGPHTFSLVRLDDETGISGTGEIAEGCVFSDGTAVLRWTTKTRSTAIYASMRELIDIHGHGGKTEVRYHLADEHCDDRACARCGHPYGLHIHDGCGWCSTGKCKCTTLQYDDARPLGELAEGKYRDGFGRPVK